MKYVFPIFIFSILSSCFSEGDCLVPATNLMYIQFKKKSAATTDTLLYFSTIEIAGVGLLKLDTALPRLFLPVDTKHNATSFIFSRRKSKSEKSTIVSVDTFNVSYTRQTQVLGKNCGAYQFYRNLKKEYTSKSFSNVKAYNNSLIRDPSTQNHALNFQLFF